MPSTKIRCLCGWVGKEDDLEKFKNLFVEYYLCPNCHTEIEVKR